MRKILFLALGIFGLSVSAVRSRELPAGDLSVGYSYLREGFSNEVNANGGTAALTGYVNRWLGITGDFGAYHASPFGISANTYTFNGRATCRVSAFRTGGAVCSSPGRRSACHCRRQRCFRFDE